MRSYLIYKWLPIVLIIALVLSHSLQTEGQKKVAATISIRDDYSISSDCSAMFLSAIR